MYASQNWWFVTTTTMKFKTPAAPFAFVKYHCDANSDFPIECHEFFNGLEPAISAKSRDELLMVALHETATIFKEGIKGAHRAHSRSTITRGCWLCFQWLWGLVHDHRVSATWLLRVQTGVAIRSDLEKSELYQDRCLKDIVEASLDYREKYSKLMSIQSVCLLAFMFLGYCWSQPKPQNIVQTTNPFIIKIMREFW